jgi:hypothetical protein
MVFYGKLISEFTGNTCNSDAAAIGTAPITGAVKSRGKEIRNGILEIVCRKNGIL